MFLKYKQKRLLKILLTVLFVIFAFPIYMTTNSRPEDTDNEAELRIWFEGTPNNRLQLQSSNDNVLSEQPISNPSWRNTAGYETVIRTQISGLYRKIQLNYKVSGNGHAFFFLSGSQSDEKTSARFYYKSFRINGKNISDDTIKTDWKQNFIYETDLSNDEELKIEFKSKKVLPFDILKSVKPLLFFSVLLAAYFAVWSKKGKALSATIVLTASFINFIYGKYFHFNIYGLFIVITVCFFTILKIVKYIAKFTTTSSPPHPRTDILFLCCFFLSLFIPAMKISNAIGSKRENRLLATYRPLFQDNKLNTTFGKDFENWFNDRFFGRDFLLKIYYGIRAMNEIIIDKAASKLKNNWYFSNTFELNAPETPNLMIYKEQIEYVSDFCNQNGIKCYMEIIPSRRLFAKEGLINNNLKKDVSVFLNSIEFTKNALNFEIIYPFDKLTAANKQDYVFFKTDHHWTEWGAYIGYKELMETVKKDFPDIYEATESDFNISYNKKIRSEFERSY